MKDSSKINTVVGQSLMDESKLNLKIISGDEKAILLQWSLVSNGETIGIPDHICLEKRDEAWIEQGCQQSLLWKLLKTDEDKEKFNKGLDTLLQRRAKASTGAISITS